jgi:ADP-heptose:LPS heptosyltransferase
VDRAIPFDALGLETLFGSQGRELESDVGSLTERRVTPIARFTRVVSWFGARDPDFVRRLTALVPDALVVPSVGEGRPVWEHLLASVGASIDDAARWRGRIVPAATLVGDGRRALQDAGWDSRARLVVVHPGAGGVAKRWPAEGFAAILARLCSERALALSIHLGPADAAAVAALRARLTGPAMVLDEPSLPRLAGVLACASAYLGNDSGVSHLAAALGTPSVVLFTRDKLAWQPWEPRARPLVVSTASLERADLDRVLATLRQLVD